MVGLFINLILPQLLKAIMYEHVIKDKQGLNLIIHLM